MKKIFAVLILLFTVSLPAQEESEDDAEGGELSEIPLLGKTAEVFIPSGWKHVLKVTGDLNKDNVEDIVMVIEGTNPENIVENADGLGPKLLNYNPRCLLVLFKESSEYRLAVHTYDFIPGPNDRDAPCLADPLMESEGIAIEKGVLRVEFAYWSSCGSYGSSRYTFKFRYQDTGMRLIGYDTFDYSRSMGDESKTSVNFLTAKESVTRGGNMFDPELNKPRTDWKTINVKPIYLKDIGLPVDFEY